MGDDNNNVNGKSIEELLEQKEMLEKMIKEQFTRKITVMFTDLKGSTAIADLQGDIAARMIIKKHIDILTPIIAHNKGILVKTMGDGTMSYYESAADAVRAGLRIQKEISDYNETIEGQSAIQIRVGISTGKAIVEEKDIFGDVVNVASRFESACQPGEIYISENTNDDLSDIKEEFFIRHIKMMRFKGKSEESKIFKVFWKKNEIEEEKANPAILATQTTQTGSAATSRNTPSTRVFQGRQSLEKVNLSEEKKKVEEAINNIEGRIISKGDILKLSGDKYRITGDIVVAEGAVISIENSELYFSENAGIIVLGTIRASKSLFSAIDPAKRWRNITIASTDNRINSIERCRIHFGGGRTLESLKQKAGITLPVEYKNILCGGGLILSGGNAASTKISHLTFFKCFANEGGGAYFHKTSVDIHGCIFEGCIAKTSDGGGLILFSSGGEIRGCAFNKCSSGRQGGGLSLVNSTAAVKESIFRNCMSRYSGGGIACISSGPAINKCRFDHCVSAKSGGGIFRDSKSKPLIEHPSFESCKPQDIS